jgi:hypothetical protein
MNEELTQSCPVWPIQIRVLLAIHVLLLVGASWLCAMLPPTSWQSFIWSGVFPIQACLIGVWLGLSRTPVHKKVVVAVGSVIGLGLILAVTLRVSHEGEVFLILLPISMGFTSVPMIVTAMLLLVTRKRTRGSLLHCPDTYALRSEGLQFGTRHLFVLTLIVAALLGVGKGAPRFLAGAEAAVGPVATLLLLGAVWGTVTLTVVWATLGRQRPHERIALAMVLAFFGGLVPPYYFGEDWRSHVVWGFALTTLAMSVVMAGSLLVVRSVGYRFVRQAE